MCSGFLVPKLSLGTRKILGPKNLGPIRRPINILYDAPF
jgi:hypothetical protein